MSYIRGPGDRRGITLRHLKSPGGSSLLHGLVDLYRSTVSKPQLARPLAASVYGAANLRVRYAALLLLDKLLQDHPSLKGASLPRQVSSDLTELGRDRAAKRKWYLTAMLPKTDLHVHIDGSVRIETVMDLAERQKVNLAEVLEKARRDPVKGKFLQDVPPLSPHPTADEIRALSQIKGVQPDFLKMLFLGFDFAIAVMQTEAGLKRTAYELVEDSYREGVMHLTAIFAPCLHGEGGLTYDRRVAAVIAGLKDGEKDFGVSWELALAIYRGVYTEKSPNHPRETAIVARRWAEKYPFQIAIDVVGAEFEMPLERFQREFEYLRGSKVILRAHAGEMQVGARNILTALDWQLKRIAHGIYLPELGDEVVRRAIDSGLVFEVAPVSNLKCRCIGEGDKNSLANHPLRRLIDAGVRVVLATDDRTVMDTDNVAQMLELESVLGMRWFKGRKVSDLSLAIANNGLAAIADPVLARRYQREAPEYFQGINALLEILAEK